MELHTSLQRWSLAFLCSGIFAVRWLFQRILRQAGRLNTVDGMLSQLNSMDSGVEMPGNGYCQFWTVIKGNRRNVENWLELLRGNEMLQIWVARSSGAELVRSQIYRATIKGGQNRHFVSSYLAFVETRRIIVELLNWILNCWVVIMNSCYICQKDFTRKGDLRRHIVKVHNTEMEAASGCQQQQEKQIG